MAVILPVLLETFATGSVAVVVGMAVWQLFKHEKLAKKEPHPGEHELQPEVTPSLLKPEPVVEVKPTETVSIAEPAPAKVVATEPEEEPMLKRHYFNNVRMMLMETTFPHPTDSMLSRHYEEMIDAKAEECLADEDKLVKLEAEYEALQAARMSKAVPVLEETLAPEDSMLKRHYLQNVRMMLTSVTSPRPADSMLRRHYDAMIEAQLAECLLSETKMAGLVAEYETWEHSRPRPEIVLAGKTEACEEEPMLKRHYMHNVRMMLMQTTFPRPTDSMLSRHYDEMIDARAEDCLADEAKMACLTEEYEACQMAEILPETEKAIKVSLVVPQDSILKRHFLSKLKSDIESTKGVRPTDSMLARHYDAIVNAEMVRSSH